MIVVSMLETFLQPFDPRHLGEFSFVSVLAYVFAVSLTVALSIFVGFHTYLLLKGSTTLEMQIFGASNPYDNGYGHNWRSVFGSQKKTWFLPIPAPDIGDGIDWDEVECERDSLLDEQDAFIL